MRLTPDEERERRDKEPSRMCQRCYGEVPYRGTCYDCGEPSDREP